MRFACLSGDGKYRYTLERAWGGPNLLPRVCWIMLNPSTADGEFDDPTIRRCMTFTDRFGYRSMIVVNLSPFRATKPAALLEHSIDELWGENEKHVLNVIESALVIAAWGSIHKNLYELEQRVKMIAMRQGARMDCLGMNGDGRPAHPLYRKRDQPLEVWLR